jgi:hypothetical protein
MREVVNFLLDRDFSSSRLIPCLFRFANTHFSPEFDTILGRTFMNLRPFFLNESRREDNTTKYDVYVGLSSQKKEDTEFILINLCGITDFAQIYEKISEEFGKRFFRLHGEINGIRTRCSKLGDIRNGMKIYVTLQNQEEEAMM